MNQLKRRYPIASAALAVGALGLASCGGSDDAAGDSEPVARSGEIPAGVVAQYETIEQEVAAEGGETASGPWRIAYVVEPAEPWFERERFREPAPGETHHIEILPIEAETGRVVPGVPITVEVRDADGEVVDRKPLRFFYAEFFHYANNFSIPEPGSYTLRARIEPPTFLRHGEESEGPALTEGAEVSFEGVELERE